MIGTLVVTLPSNYTGGELIVGRGEELEGVPTDREGRSQWSRSTPTARHEVLPVKSGYRIDPHL